jgi:hypothetical protein
MRTQYWYDARKLMRQMGFSKLKSKSMAWKMKHLAEDLATFNNPSPREIRELLATSMEIRPVVYFTPEMDDNYKELI